MLLTVKGIVVKTVKYSDFDRLITVITEEHGKLFFKACGINSLRSKNAAACAMYTYSEFVIRQNGDHAYLVRSSPLYYPLRRGCDLSRLALAGYFAQLSLDTVYDRETSSQVLKLLVNALFVLSKKDRDPDLIKAVFELRLLTALGYAPLLDGCASCGALSGELAVSFFDPIEGDLRCADCHWEGRLRLERDCVALMKRSVECDEKSAYAVTVPQELLKSFCRVCEKFLLSQLERSYDTLDFYKETKELMKQ